MSYALVTEKLLPGVLNNLSLELQVSSDESFHLFSSHHVQPASGPRNVSRNLKTSQRSLTPSPQKARRMQTTKLIRWSVRLCQRIDKAEQGKIQDSNEDSATEDEADDGGKGASEAAAGTGTLAWRERKFAWYVAHVGEKEAEQLCSELGVDGWELLEAKIRSAWDAGSVDVLGRSQDQKDDDTYKSVRLKFLFDSKGGATTHKAVKQEVTKVKKEEGVDGDTEGKQECLSLEVYRMCGADSEAEASTAAIEAQKALGTLRTRAQSLMEERDNHRKLLHNNRRQERFKEASSSLINPGRIKRKSVDDEGFEGE